MKEKSEKNKTIDHAPRSTLRVLRHKGFTLLEALTLLFVFSVIVLTFYKVIASGTGYINFSKDQLGALAVANEKMEIARNLTYDSVGATGEACSGSIPQDENVTENGRTYHVHTLAAYVDDPFDGTLGGIPKDLIPEDYKLVKITVSWTGPGTDNGSVSLSSRFVPNGLEVADPNSGELSINVLSNQAGGAAVTGATVQIVNSDIGLNETLQTDSAGNVMLVGAKAALQDYQITVSKSGYETVTTLPPFPTTPYNPVDVWASVISGSLNTVNIIENQTANLTVLTADPSGNPVPNINFTLTGGRELGTSVAVPYGPVYNLNASDQTDSNGKKEYDAISPGQYTFALANSVNGYVLVNTEPVSPLSLVSGQSLNLKAELASTSATSVLVRVSDSVSAAILSGASVELSNASGYDQTVTTDGNGTAFFPTSGGSTFQPGTYTLKVANSGYQTDTETLTVSSGALLNKTVSLVSN